MDGESVKLLAFGIEDADGIGFETYVDANEESILHVFHLLSDGLREVDGGIRGLMQNSLAMRTQVCQNAHEPCC